jgi:hypothetical protein
VCTVLGIVTTILEECESRQIPLKHWNRSTRLQGVASWKFTTLMFDSTN